MKVVRINKGKFFPLPIRLLGAISIALLILLVLQQFQKPFSIIFSILLSLLPPAIWFAAKLIIINPQKQWIFDGVWAMGFQIGKKEKFGSMDGILIQKVKTKKTVYSLPDKQTLVSDTEYHAFLKVDDNRKFYLLSHPVEDRIIEKTKKIGKMLNVKID